MTVTVTDFFTEADHPSLPPREELPTVEEMLDEIEETINAGPLGPMVWPTVSELEAIVDARRAAGTVSPLVPIVAHEKLPVPKRARPVSRRKPPVTPIIDLVKK